MKNENWREAWGVILEQRRLGVDPHARPKEADLGDISRFDKPSPSDDNNPSQPINCGFCGHNNLDHIRLDGCDNGLFGYDTVKCRACHRVEVLTPVYPK